MKYQAILGSKALPGVGQITVPFPIPDSEYDHTIELLEDMGIGSPTAQDCQVDGLDSPYPILNRLTTQSVNVDELDYLAKRLDSFSEGENIKFEAMASKLNLSSIRDFINLTFCCQRATVITDFSDLERIGKVHALTVSGDSMPVEAFERLDYRAVSLDLIQRAPGMVTPYGVVYSNGMKLEQVYDGQHFPAYLHQTPQDRPYPAPRHADTVQGAGDGVLQLLPLHLRSVPGFLHLPHHAAQQHVPDGGQRVRGGGDDQLRPPRPGLGPGLAARPVPARRGQRRWRNVSADP